MANWNRRSRVSQNRNRRQSQRRSNRRGGAPPTAPPPPPAPEVRPDFLKGKKMTGPDNTGHSICPPLSEQDCVKVKPCSWVKGSGRSAGYCRRRSDRDSTMHSTTAKYNEMTAALDATRATKLKELYESSESEDDSTVSVSSVSSQESVDEPVRVPTASAARAASSASVASAASSAVSRSSSSRKSPTPAQLRRASAKASGEKYVPTKAPNAPKGCVQKDYVLKNKLGTSYTSSRCIDSKDPSVNDVVNCMINPETNKCKRVVRE